jgi:hypothetical protein
MLRGTLSVLPATIDMRTTGKGKLQMYLEPTDGKGGEPGWEAGWSFFNCEDTKVRSPSIMMEACYLRPEDSEWKRS